MVFWIRNKTMNIDLERFLLNNFFFFVIDLFELFSFHSLSLSISEIGFENLKLVLQL